MNHRSALGMFKSAAQLDPHRGYLRHLFSNQLIQALDSKDLLFSQLPAPMVESPVRQIA